MNLAWFLCNVSSSTFYKSAHAGDYTHMQKRKLITRNKKEPTSDIELVRATTF